MSSRYWFTRMILQLFQQRSMRYENLRRLANDLDARHARSAGGKQPRTGARA